MIKKTTKKPAVKIAKPVKKEKYIESVGRRKTAAARVRLIPGGSGITVNGKDSKEYFKIAKFQEMISAPLSILELIGKHGITVVVYGGGMAAQAEAVRHGVSRALVKLDSENKKRLKKYDFLTRDPRMVERKKYGLKKARRAPQWAKR